jgi:hypothetical protein
MPNHSTGVVRIFLGNHVVMINNAPWRRVWINRGAYVHPYHLEHWNAARRTESHKLIERSARERVEARLGHRRVEEHRHP